MDSALSLSFEQGGLLTAAESVAQVAGKGEDEVRPQKVPANKSCHLDGMELAPGCLDLSF